MAKRRKLPDEDLAAAVADMISSPITRANLSFLQPQQEARPMGVNAQPVGVVSIQPDTEPMGLVAIPVGLELVPPRLSEIQPLPPIVASRAATPPTQQALGLPSSRVMWQAERIGTVFESNRRLRRIQQAQDALSPIEEKVYNLLWGPRNHNRDEFRLAQFSLQRICNEAHINIKTVRELLPRLIEKSFVEVAAEADVRRNIPTTYRVWGYTAILTRLREQNRFYVVKTGKGVFYAHPMQATVEPILNSTPMGVNYLPPMGVESAPVGPKPMGPMGASGLKPMGLTGTPSKDINKDTIVDTTTTSSAPPYEQLSTICREAFGAEPDQQILTDMVAACHEKALQTTGQPATEEELLYFATMRAQVIRKAPNIRNHIAVLRKALPECFVGAAFRAYRSAAVAKLVAVDVPTDIDAESKIRQRLWTEISERHKTAQGFDMNAIAEDPDLDGVGKLQAKEMLERLGRFTDTGL